jgi:hypothetical protein
MLNPVNGWRINPFTNPAVAPGPRAAGRVWSPDPMSREAEPRRRCAMRMARVPTDRHWCAAMLA